MAVALAMQLREGTKKSHTMAENTGFISCFLKGVVDKSSYRNLLVDLYFVYSAMEEEIEKLTEEQVEVVAEVLQVEAEDVEIIAEAVKDDEIVAEAVEEYVERAVENADVENYTLADVVTEVQFETFLENPIETFVDIDFEDISIESIGDDMTQDQKEKAQEVVVPVILTRIASMAAFVFRRSL